MKRLCGPAKQRIESECLSPGFWPLAFYFGAGCRDGDPSARSVDFPSSHFLDASLLREALLAQSAERDHSQRSVDAHPR